MDVTRFMFRMRKMFVCKRCSNVMERQKTKIQMSCSEKDFTEEDHAKKTGNNQCSKEDRPPCHSYKNGTCSFDRECDCWHPPHCKYFRPKKCRFWKECLHVHAQAADRSTRLQKRGEEQGSSKQGSAIAILSTANQQLGNKTRRAELSETAEDAHWKAEGNFERMRQFKGLDEAARQVVQRATLKEKNFCSERHPDCRGVPEQTTV